MQKRGMRGNVRRRGNQIDVGVTKIVGSVSEEQYRMESKGETRWERASDEQRTRFDQREEDEKL